MPIDEHPTRNVVDSARSMVALNGGYEHVHLTWEQDDRGQRFYVVRFEKDGRKYEFESTQSHRWALFDLERALAEAAVPEPDPDTQAPPLPVLLPLRALEKAMDREVAPERVLRALPKESALVTQFTLADALMSNLDGLRLEQAETLAAAIIRKHRER